MKDITGSPAAKFLMLVIVIGLIFGVAHLGHDHGAHEKTETAIEQVSEQTLAEPIQLAQSNCYAATTCWNGVTISCYAYGAGCTWFVQPGQYVTCTGMIGNVWTTASYSC